MKARVLATIVLTTLSASAATSVTNSNSVSITVNSTTSTVNPNTTGITNGSVTATAKADQLTLTNPGLNLNNLEYSGSGATFASLTAAKTSSGGTSTTFSGNATYSVAFTLGAGETAQVVFDLGYAMSTSENASITWGVTGPQSVSAIAGNITTPGTASITQQTATISTPGTYTFTLTGAISNNGTITNGNNSSLSNIAFTNIDLKVTSLSIVPEPSSTALLGLASLGLLRRRR